MKVKVRKIQTCGRERITYRGKYTKIMSVYADDERPFNKGDIVADFAWRRNHSSPVKSKVIRNLVIPILEKKGYNTKDISVNYDKMCGCSMCPCSPGYTVRILRELNDHAHSDDIIDVWTTIEKGVL